MQIFVLNTQELVDLINGIRNSRIVAKVVENDTHGMPKLIQPICKEIIVEQDTLDIPTTETVTETPADVRSVYRLFSNRCELSNTFVRQTLGFETCSHCKISHDHFERRFATWAVREEKKKKKEEHDLESIGELCSRDGMGSEYNEEQLSNDNNEDTWVEAQIALRRKPLDSRELARFRSVLVMKDDEQKIVVIEKYAIDMTVNKLCCLRNRTWLNDEVVNFYMCLLQDRSNTHFMESNRNLSYRPSQLRLSYYFNSFFMAKLLEKGMYDFSRVHKWTKKFNVFEKERIFFPINIGNTHWTLLVLFVQEKKICYYDSMSGRGNRYLNAIMQWLEDVGQNPINNIQEKVHVDREGWTLLNVEGLPQQDNGFDCAMFLCMYSDFITDDLPLDGISQNDMEHYRQKVGTDILRGSLNYVTE